MKLMEAQTGPTSLSLSVAQPLDAHFPHSQCTRGILKEHRLQTKADNVYVRHNFTELLYS